MSINTSNHGEYLKSYIVQVLNSNGDILEKSPVQYTSSSVDKNSFSYLLDVHNQKKYPVSATYTINLIFTTNNNYIFTKTYYFQIIDYIFFDNFNSLQWNFETRSTDPFFQYTTGSGYNDKQIITKEDGIIKFNVTCGDMPPGYLYIRRESSIDEFQTSELICCKEFLGGNQSDEDDDDTSDLQKISCSIVDDTVGSLTTYKYSAQYQTLNNR